MNFRTELQAFQMVNNLGYEEALKRVNENIEIHSNSLSTFRINKSLIYLNLLKSEILRLNEYENDER